VLADALESLMNLGLFLEAAVHDAEHRERLLVLALEVHEAAPSGIASSRS
jgi:hypothetical protein